MGKRGREMVGMDPDALVADLNAAMADEWLAYYQYWIGAKVLSGPMRGEAQAELVQHAADELRHADMLAMRVIQLGGTPVLTPREWLKITNCGYDAPADTYVMKVLEQNIKGERCAIDTYDKLMKATDGKDPVTHQMAFEIMRDEIEHEDDLQALAEDIEEMMRRMRT